MKKKKILFIVSLIILILLIITIIVVKKKNDIKNKWYVEVITEYINVREEPNVWSRILNRVNKDEKYVVLEMDQNNSFFWYKIKIDGKYGWIANPKKSLNYLKDYNNPNDILAPTIKFYKNEAHFKSIDDINYDMLELWDDKSDYKVTHKVYKELIEEDIYQYWITYTITDATNKSSSKTQKVTFDIEPDISKIEDLKK